MRALLVQELRDRRNAVVGWTLGWLTLVGMYVATWPTVRAHGAQYDEILNDLPAALRSAIGTSAEGAFMGFLAGITGGLLGALLSIPIDLMMGPFQHRLMEYILSMNPDMPSEIRDLSERSGTGPAAVAFKLVLGVVTGAVFGMIGGLLGVALFKKKTPLAPPAPGRVDILPPE